MIVRKKIQTNIGVRMLVRCRTIKNILGVGSQQSYLEPVRRKSALVYNASI